jgi:hypothetical protein
MPVRAVANVSHAEVLAGTQHVSHRALRAESQTERSKIQPIIAPARWMKIDVIITYATRLSPVPWNFEMAVLRLGSATTDAERVVVVTRCRKRTRRGIANAQARRTFDPQLVGRARAGPRRRHHRDQALVSVTPLVEPTQSALKGPIARGPVRSSRSWPAGQTAQDRRPHHDRGARHRRRGQKAPAAPAGGHHREQWVCRALLSNLIERGPISLTAASW